MYRQRSSSRKVRSLGQGLYAGSGGGGVLAGGGPKGSKCSEYKLVSSKGHVNPVRRCKKYTKKQISDATDVLVGSGVLAGGVLAGGVLAGGKYKSKGVRYCDEYKMVTSKGHTEPVRRCKKYSKGMRPIAGGEDEGPSYAQIAAAERNPWLQFCRHYRQQTGRNDLKEAAKEYHKIYD